MNLDVNAFFSSIKDKSSARYVSRKGQRIKIEDYQNMDPQKKEELNLPTQDDIWAEVDSQLDELNKQWNLESNKFRKKLLELKYDLLVEQTAKDDPIKIEELTAKICELEKQLSSV